MIATPNRWWGPVAGRRPQPEDKIPPPGWKRREITILLGRAGENRYTLNVNPTGHRGCQGAGHRVQQGDGVDVVVVKPDQQVRFNHNRLDGRAADQPTQCSELIVRGVGQLDHDGVAIRGDGKRNYWHILISHNWTSAGRCRSSNCLLECRPAVLVGPLRVAVSGLPAARTAPSRIHPRLPYRSPAAFLPPQRSTRSSG